MKTIKEFVQNDDAVIPMILYIVTIVGVGALYTLFFIYVAYPKVAVLVPESDTKTFIMMCMYSIPLFVLLIGVLSVIKEGIKESFYSRGGY